MSTRSIDESIVVAREPSAEVKGSAIHGVLIGLITLGLLVGFVALALVLTALARQLVAGSAAASSVEQPDRWISTGHCHLRDCLLACFTTSCSLAAERDSSAG